jgi:hypothetical protein
MQIKIGQSTKARIPITTNITTSNVFLDCVTMGCVGIGING